MRRHPSRHTGMRQQGVALILALVFLLLLTLLGITALNTTSLEEKMANNVKDRNVAFQATETALVAGENWIFNQIGKPIFPNNSIGLYVPSTTETPVWDSVSWSSGNVVVYPNTPGSSGSGSLSKVQTQPKYIIEDLGEVSESGGTLVMSASYKSKGVSVMRVTARGTGGTDAAVTMLQTVYSRPF